MLNPNRLHKAGLVPAVRHLPDEGQGLERGGRIRIPEGMRMFQGAVGDSSSSRPPSPAGTPTRVTWLGCGRCPVVEGARDAATYAGRPAGRSTYGTWRKA
jgi:hypothetical protein